MRDSLFGYLSSAVIAKLISSARTRVCYVAPGVQNGVAKAMCSAVASNPKLRMSVSVDFSEAVLRMGYGSLEAVELLRNGGIEVVNSPGLRAAVIIVDDKGWIFTPTALYLEAEPQSEETPNAVRLTREQIEAVALRISPKERETAIAEAVSVEDREKAENVVLEIGSQPVSQAEFDLAKTSIKQAPLVKFSLIRQVRVFEPYLQYVDLNLRGAAVQRQRIRIPSALLRLSSSEDLEGRLRMTFDLIERDSQISSKTLETNLSELRKNLTRSLGPKFGRVTLKAARALLDQRVEEFRGVLKAHRAAIENTIQEKLTSSRKLVIEYYLPAAKANPPDELIGRSVSPNLTETTLRDWIAEKLDAVFPSAEKVVSKMTLDVSFKDVTYETLNDPEFVDRLKEAYPEIDWDKPYSEFRAMGEDQSAA